MAVACCDDPFAELDEVDRLGVEVLGARFEARQLEQVDHHVVEAADLAHDHVERLLRAVGEFVAPGVEHLDGRGERGDGRAELVADVGCESLFALDSVLHRVGHVVERAREPVEVGVVLVVEAAAEIAGRDVARGVGDAGEGPEQPAAGREPEERRDDGGEDRADDQRGREDAQGAFSVLSSGNASMYPTS